MTMYARAELRCFAVDLTSALEWIKCAASNPTAVFLENESEYALIGRQIGAQGRPGRYRQVTFSLTIIDFQISIALLVYRLTYLSRHCHKYKGGKHDLMDAILLSDNIKECIYKYI